jgi:hypothetical protein
VALFCLLFVVYNANLRQASSGDTLMARYVPISLLRWGTLNLDRLVQIDPIKGRNLNQWIARGHLYDSFPPIAPLLALPVYAPAVWLGRPADPRLLSNLASKIAASIMAALSCVLLYEALRRILPSGGSAWVCALAYGLGTSMWSTASQGLWTHGPAVLTLSGAILLLTQHRPGWAATLMAIGAVARPAILPLIPILVSFDFAPAPESQSARANTLAWLRFAMRHCWGAACVIAAGAFYNYWLFGDVTGSNAMRNAQFTRLFATHDFGGSLPIGLLGLLVSPNRGLLVFSPVVVFAFWGGARAWSRSAATRLPEAARLARLAGIGFAVVLLVYSKYLTWWAGDAFGPRYLTDVTPLLGVMLGLGLAELGWSEANGAQMPPVRWLFGILLGYSVFIQAVGAFCWPSTWNRGYPPAHERLWDWKRTEIATCLREGPRLDPIARRVLRALRIEVPEPSADEAATRS